MLSAQLHIDLAKMGYLWKNDAQMWADKFMVVEGYK